jgi:hypothetical protein
VRLRSRPIDGARAAGLRFVVIAVGGLAAIGVVALSGRLRRTGTVLLTVAAVLSLPVLLLISR